MKFDRLLGILWVLLRQEAATAPQLAQRFEVSRRTINRDIEALCQAGIPLVTRQGRGGGIAIAEGCKINTALFTEKELQTLLSGLAGVGSVSPAARLAALAEKLAGQGSQPIAQGPMVINLSYYDSPSLVEKIEALQQAIADRRLVTFRYYYSKGVCQRRVEPYRLVFQWSAWYLLGYCLTREDFRLFKLGRLWELECSPTPFAPRPLPARALDFARYLAPEGTCFRLKALFAERAAYRLVEEYGAGCYTQLAGKGLLLERDFVSYENMREWVLSFGEQVEVLEPEPLRRDVWAQAKRLVERYSER